MHVLDPALEVALRLYLRVAGAGRAHRERGDVPGWVLVTVMTAGLVTVLWVFARERLRELLGDALDGVTGT